MWNASSGRRTFTGNFGRLLAEGILLLLDEILSEQHDDEPFERGVPSFDQATPEQKIWLLRQVAFALLRDEAECELTAASEGTVDVVFQTLTEALENECDFDDAPDDDRFYFRNLVLKAVREEGLDEEDEDDEEEEPLSLEHSDVQEWQFALETLLEQILWDADYATDFIADLAPEKRAKIGEEFGFSDDYFVAIPDDPKSQEAKRLAREIQELCNSFSTRSADENDGD